MAVGNGQTALVADSIGFAGPDVEDSVAGDTLDLNNFEKLPASEVAVSALSPGLGLRQSGTNAAHVQLLMDASGTVELPPLLVQEEGWRVIDGLHRLEAAKRRGDTVVKARFVDCTDSEAVVLAMKANSSHGLPLSKTDRMFGAKSVLAAHPDWSDRAIASITGLSAKTIASLRDRSAGGTQLGGKRLGRDGKRRPVTPGEGRLRTADYINAHPDASLRQVARATDVSLGTVHDVRARLRRGANPERNGRRASSAQPPSELPSAQPPSVQPPSAQQRPTTRISDARTAIARTADARPAAHPAREDAGTVTTAPTAPTANGTSSLRRNHTDLPPTWPQVASKMAGDPAVRYTDSGKEFLRWMALHAADPHRWREFLNTVPAHWQDIVASVADDISQEWSLFAQQLKNKQETA
ncbi:ParB/RepB/Spo0J family partition protein [Actinomadura rudentiformis]|uniref:Nuclease n=1 Tax=Actinomadura rudentiformis TaxID=359158 RepID=A0A6H9YUR2_9ACTN|nr:ParB/RepB/Spo0J family partition protein [Actinomadura rudentiformis]KAB2343609.1 nuclease [Actinomadura rudentiformis]